jgi:hypothetical protein
MTMRARSSPRIPCERDRLFDALHFLYLISMLEAIEIYEKGVYLVTDYLSKQDYKQAVAYC